MRNMHIMITFTEPILGTGNSNQEIHSEFIASKAPDAKSREEEIAAIGREAVEEKTTTIFSKDTDGTPVLFNYQVKGFFKEACGMLRRMTGEACAKESLKMKNYKKTIDGCIEPKGEASGYSRKIRLIVPEGVDITNIETLQRPLRGQTAQGERIALAASEMLPAGTKAEFWIEAPEACEKAIYEWLKYGEKHGLCQWRNAGYGRFTFEVLDVTEC